MNFLPLTSILLATLIINNAIRRSNRNEREKKRLYLEREKKASLTPSKNLDKIRWISVPSDLPLDIATEDDHCKRIQKTIKNLSTKKITNLGEFTNTDLKLEYGAANLEELSDADANCIVLLRSLTELANIYIEKKYIKEAVELLEFAVESGSDDPSNFEILANHYLENDDIDSVISLKKHADELDTYRGEQISANLNRRILLMEAVIDEQTNEGNT